MLKEDLKHITIDYLRETDQISVRATNCCKNIGLDTLYKIVLCFEDKGSFFNQEMENAGRKTCEELDQICINAISKIKKEKQPIIQKEVFKIINELTQQEQKTLLSLADLIIEKENFIKEKIQNFKNYCANDFSFAIDFYRRNDHLPMFWILEQHIINDTSREAEILTSTFNIIKNTATLSLNDIAEKHNLSRERVRQIRKEIFQTFFEITDEDSEHKKNSNLIRYKELLQNQGNWIYILEFTGTNLSQVSFEIQEYLKKEQCNLSVEFAMQIIACLFRDRFSLFGGFEISNRDRVLKNTFLIRKDLADIFNFEQFIEEFKNHIAENKTEYDLSIDEYLTNSACWVSTIDLNKFDSIISVLKNILLHEFSLYSNFDGLITIPITKEKNLFDVIYEILQRNGHPMHLDDIFIEFKKILPEHKYTEASRLRSWLQRHEAISFRNRKSVYTLKEWEHIKSGTIRDAIVEFLSKNDLPQTADDITNYVLKHFPKTNIPSVRTTMFNDTQKRFLFFNNSLFGLVSKEYPSEYEETKPLIERKSFEQRLYDLEKFLTENDHFPFSSSENKEETSLYRWWQIQNKNTAKLTVQQKSEIKRVKSQYADYDTDKSIYEWFCHLNNFKLFVLENRRLPSMNGSERFLYGWFRRAKDDFSNQRLNEKQRKKYAELFKEINYAEK